MRRINCDTDYYRRDLPHLQREGAQYFVTTRLIDSIPKSKLAEIRDRRDLLNSRLAIESDPTLKAKLESELSQTFGAFDKLLDRGTTGRHWLQQRELAQATYDAILSTQDTLCHVDCFTIMSNHIHLLLEPARGVRLDQAMQRIKQISGFHCNKLLSRHGMFWQDRNYDHILREGQWERIVRYILNNPVKAGLVGHWKEWEWTYLRPGVEGFD